MRLLINILLTAVAVWVADYFIPGVALESYVTAIIAGVVLGVVNALIRPIVLLLTLPINFLTLGLFTFVINALMVMLVAEIVPGFEVTGFWAALLFSVIVSILKMLINRLDGGKN
jgi:putative membrane protein